MTTNDALSSGDEPGRAGVRPVIAIMRPGPIGDSVGLRRPTNPEADDHDDHDDDDASPDDEADETDAAVAVR
jgi:hypothetical protein